MCQEGILLSIFALLLISFLIFLHERSANFKAYAIKRLHGYSIFKIFIDDLKKSTIYFLLLPSCAAIVTFLFLLISPYHGQLLFFLKWLIIAYSVLTILLLMLNLLSYASLSLIDVSQMVKGKRPYKILRSIAFGSKFAMILIVFLLLIQNVASLSDLKKIQKHNEIWRKVDNYYSLYFAPFITGNKEYGDVAEKFNRLFAEEEKYGAILIKNNNASNPKKDNFEPTNGNVLIVNNNFVSLYRKFDKNIFAGKRINQQKTINLFLPTKAQRKKTAIEKNFIDLFQFEKGDPNQSAAVSFSAKNMNKDYYIFTFNSRASIDQPYADSPLIALIQNQSVQRYFYYAAATNGGIIFKDYQHLRNSLDKYGLSHYISGITSFKDDVADQISSLDKEIFLLTITIILVIFVLVLSIIMDIGEYFQ
ncbi:bacteriocin, partial [Oenococcus oeni]